MSASHFARDPFSFRGRVEMRPFASDALRENRLGDPFEREVPVYLPPGAERGERYPVLFVLAGFTGRGQNYLETHPWKRGVVPLFDAAVARGEIAPAILVLPDCFTKVGGSQYVNSSLVGRYEDHVAQELVGWIDANYPTKRGRRGVVGKSSGGFGALHLAMRHPSTFPVAASISGDVGFEFCIAPCFFALLRTLRKFGGDPWALVEAVAKKPSPSSDEFESLNAIAMSACYSPNADSRFGLDLPIDIETGARRDEVWKRWLEFDPLVAGERFVDNLKRLEFLHVECGLNDEFNMQWPLRQMVAKLRARGVAVDHEEHEGSHRNIDERYLKLLPKLIAKLG